MNWLPDAIDAITQFVSSNVGPTMTLLGALLALLTARFVHYDRVRREHNERIRKLLGEYVAAIAARDDAAEILEGRRAERRVISSPLDVVRQLKMDAPTPAVQAADARVLDAREELRRAESRVSSLFFQISIAEGKQQSDLIFAAKAIATADGEPEFVRAYNFALKLAIHQFGDSRGERRAARKQYKELKTQVVRDWDNFIARGGEFEQASAAPKTPSPTSPPQGGDPQPLPTGGGASTGTN